jgi:uncharacterized membrane-anchored protein YjiN (DUF445 family)
MKKNMVDKAKQLRQHKTMATGLFLLMVVIYCLCIYALKYHPHIWIGYVRAFSEAAMIGALADWFAVTALFHHPLGIPIPHTNLIEKSKQSIGDNLGNFVVTNFLTSENLRPYIQKLTVSKYLSTWLSSVRNQQLIAEEASKMLKDILLKLEDKTVTDFIAKKGTELLSALPLHQLVGNGLQYFLQQKEHEKLITLLASKVKEYISDNQTLVESKVKAESYFFIPKFVDQKLAEKITHGLIAYFDEIEKDPEHKIRKEVDEQLYQFVNDLKTLPKWSQALKELSANLLGQQQVEQYANDIWASLKQTLLAELSSNDSAMRNYFKKMIADFTKTLEQDEVMQQKIDQWVRATAYKYILKNTKAVGDLISNTIGNWQGRELSHKLELEVGKDLQFIRVNGTVVGGLVGLLIYTLTQWLSK